MNKFKVGDRVRSIHDNWMIPAGTPMVITYDDESRSGMRYMVSITNYHDNSIWWEDVNLEYDISYINEQKLRAALGLTEKVE